MVCSGLAISPLTALVMLNWCIGLQHLSSFIFIFEVNNVNWVHEDGVLPQPRRAKLGKRRKIFALACSSNAAESIITRIQGAMIYIR
ncbi:hypothetical protein NC653_015052 [Populus alba x Populus x berolinensis]|uniref:Uncharacterized protein n=1 Tax=Populus alba x Populus x berolinensis TaxID=444605 RepID=A0AAD6W4J4_9ROSI|nr:hypothetical protein NC653_015052 [Populus alba x Populus x berolinensis]